MSEAGALLSLFQRVENAEFFCHHFKADRDRALAERDAARAQVSEMERASKIEASDRAEIRAQAYRCGFSDAQAGKVTPPRTCSEVDETAETPGASTMKTLERSLTEKGAREERERIIALLVGSDNLCLKAKPADYTPGLQWDLLNTWDEVRAALEPKP